MLSTTFNFLHISNITLRTYFSIDLTQSDRLGDIYEDLPRVLAFRFYACCTTGSPLTTFLEELKPLEDRLLFRVFIKGEGVPLIYNKVMLCQGAGIADTCIQLHAIPYEEFLIM